MIVLAALVVAGAAFAWWSYARASTATEFFAAGRRAGALVVGVAGTAAGVSAFTFVGGPGLFVVAGAGSLWIVLSAPLTGALQCWAVGEPIAALVRRRPVLTVPELLGVHLESTAVRGAAAAVVLVGCVASLAVQVKAVEVLGQVFLGVPGGLVAAAVMLTTAAYATTGGMRASLSAEALQGAVMALVGLALAVAALAAVGGPGAALAELTAARPELLGAFGTIAPRRALAWFLLFCLGTCAQPHYIQKFLMLRSPSELRTLPAVLTGALAVMLTVWLGLGLAGATLVARGTVAPTDPDTIVPALIAGVGPWAVLAGAILVIAAVGSTSASLLNLATAAVTRDAPAALGRAPGSLAASRAVTVAVGLAALAVGLASDRAVAILGIMGWGFFTAALLPTMVVGLAWRGVTGAGACTAIIGGAVVDLVLEAQRSALPPGAEPGLVGAAVGVLVLVGVSTAVRSTSGTPVRESDRAS